MKYSCFTVDSIRLIAEGVCVSEPSIEVAALMSEDVTFRLRRIISKAMKFMQHSNRATLSCADINKALKLSDCQPVFGHECKPNERLRYSYLAEAQIFKYEETLVDLEARYKDTTVKALHERIISQATCEGTPTLRVSIAKTPATVPTATQDTIPISVASLTTSADGDTNCTTTATTSADTNTLTTESSNTSD